MNLQELIQHARDNGLVIPVSEMTYGQLGVIVQWRGGTEGRGGTGSYRRRAPGTVVLRAQSDRFPLLVVGTKDGDFNVGSYWDQSSLSEIEVMPLTPEVPSLPRFIPTPFSADDLSAGQAGVVTEWNGVGETAFERTMIGALVIRERGDALIVVQRSPEDTEQIHDAGEFWRPENAHQVQVVRAEIQLPYEVEE